MVFEVKFDFNLFSRNQWFLRFQFDRYKLFLSSSLSEFELFLRNKLFLRVQFEGNKLFFYVKFE